MRLERTWTGEHGGLAWERERWGRRARARRDPAAVAGLLELSLGGPGSVLDVACGTGRLRDSIVAAGHRWTGVDASIDQLGAGSGARVRASALALPFADDAFDAVVACRFLHHLGDDVLFERAVAELVRVARVAVVASYWDRATWPYFVRGGKERDGSGRVGRRASEVHAAFARCGAPDVEIHRPAWRFSAQTFALALKAPSEDARRDA